MGEPTNNHILLIGFMGSGKTSVSRRMSKLTGLSLIDLDQRIEALEHRKIPEIFDDVGEAGFRRIETQVLRGLTQEGRSIVSCGGGVVLEAENRRILKELGCVIYLKVPLDEAVGRISQPETRPLLSGSRPVSEIYDERIPLYEETADITIETSGRSVHEIATACIKVLEERGAL
ncbi:MAG: shikimate kinase [Coriobacteriaceae bacterium]|nr:shikimate kinase [Coriobacteriaceae bacterium]